MNIPRGKLARSIVLCSVLSIAIEDNFETGDCQEDLFRKTELTFESDIFIFWIEEVYCFDILNSYLVWILFNTTSRVQNLKKYFIVTGPIVGVSDHTKS